MPHRKPLAMVVALIALVMFPSLVAASSISERPAPPAGTISDFDWSSHPAYLAPHAPGDWTGAVRVMDFGDATLGSLSQPALPVISNGIASPDPDGGPGLPTAIFIVIALGALTKYFTSSTWRQFVTDVWFPRSY